MLANLLIATALIAVPLTLSAKESDPVQVDIITSKGSVVLELWPEKAPKTVQNFLDYANSGFYEGTVFHRVIDGFMIQGGGMDHKLEEKKTRESIVNEATNQEPNKRGTIAMARTSDVNSATAQFFINLSDNKFLDHRDKSASGFGYCVFGKVIKGMDVVDAIANVKTGNQGYYQDVPKEAVIINKVRVY